MKRVFLPLILLGGCSEMPSTDYSTATAPDRNGPQGPSTPISDARDWSELDKLGGKQVSFDGLFSQIGAQHGIVTLASGVKIYIPHFDLWARDKPWFNYVGHRVEAGGLLHTYTRDIPGYQGPSIEINSFRVLE